MKLDKKIAGHQKYLLRICHKCGHANESVKELERCQKCSKSFLPLMYATSGEAKTTQEYKNLFQESSEVDAEDVIKGLAAVWD
ncbi:MAG: hypothetical protein A2X86_09105 [Bdellovibrionales bacterium GWA2_49_15]|nr:MAG: hypothetical protein A2X86_09105 [Bdellovibrionales bacterium GWA2_49_15]HAZ12935.1 hypothetical protein [Bdellovibrionales bacterium]